MATHARPVGYPVRARVDGELITEFTAAVRVDSVEAPPPAVPGPGESTPYDMAVTGRDLRVVDGVYTGDPDAPLRPPVTGAWVRFRAVPDDPYLHAGLLAQFTGHMPIAATLRPQAGIGQNQVHRTICTAITTSLHARVRADQWLLCHHESTCAGDGMTRAQCRVHGVDGHLVASFVVEAMVRGFADQRVAHNERTAL